MINIKLEEIELIKEESPNLADRIHKAAVYYASLGMYIVPLVQGGKALQGGGISYSSATRKIETLNRWFGLGGKYRGCNIGIACGRQDGVFAIDVDDKGLKNGTEQLLLLEREFGKIEAPKQVTPSGGYHYLFGWAPNAGSSTEKLAPGIDTRGGDPDACRSHIVAWPSVVGDEEYHWVEEGSILPPPPWVLDKLGESWRGKKAVGTGRGNENVGDSDLEQKYSIRQLGNIMKSIDINDISYDDWLQIGQAIHSQHPTMKGLELWDRWSKTGDRYKPRECEIRWHRFDGAGPIRIGTLMYIAQQHGYDPRAQGRDVEVKGDIKDIDTIVDEINETYAVTVVGGSVKVLMEKEPNEMDPLSDRFVLLDRNGFKTLMENEKILMPNNQGSMSLKSKADIWLADERRRTYPGGVIFAPNQPPEKDGYYNMWEPWKYERVGRGNGSWDLFKTHIKNVLCSGNEEHCEWILDWIADMIQDPQNPKGGCIVLSGEEGTGKGTFCHIVGELFGKHYKHVTDESHLIGNFNGHLQDAIFVFADEVTYGGSKKTAGKLKSMVTEPTLMTERKGVDAVRTKNHIRLAIASNEDWFIPAGPNSRRWFVLAVSNKYASNHTYFNAMWEQMKNGGFEAMHWDLSRRHVTSDLRKAPVTKKLMEQRARSAVQDSVVEWWAQCLEFGCIANLPPQGEWKPGEEEDDSVWFIGKIHSNVLYEAYQNWCSSANARRVSLQIFGMTLDKLGVKKTRTMAMVSNRRTKITVYNIPSLGSAAAKLMEATGIVITKETEKEDE